MTAVGVRRIPVPAPRAGSALRRRLVMAVDLVGWSALTVVGCLLVWIAGTAVGFGWRPLVLDGQSMAPALHRGDVAMIEPVAAGERLASGTVVTFRAASGDLVTHRITVLDPEGRYVTRGDANASDDVVTVDPGDVVGAGRLVVPAVGMPLLWLRGDEAVPLAALAGASLLFLGSQASRHRTRRSRRLA